MFFPEEVVNIKKEWDRKLEKEPWQYQGTQKNPRCYLCIDPKKEKICVQEAHSLPGIH